MHYLTLALVIIGALSSDAVAGESRRRDQQLPIIIEAPSEPEKIGCYWERGREFCSRYCYIEVNNRRYCREREREAYSQAPVLVFPAPYTPMK